MQRIFLKRNFLLYMLFAVAVVVTCFGFIFSRPAFAEGNNSGSGETTGQKLVRISLDVNGTVQDSGNYDNAILKFNDNNTKRYSKRFLSGHTMLAVANGVAQGSTSYYFTKSSIINGSDCFIVDTMSSSNRNQQIIITAKKITELGKAYFTVDIDNGDVDGNAVSGVTFAKYKITFEVTVTDTFVQQATSAQQLYVGYKVNNDGNEYYVNDAGETKVENSYQDGAHKSILTLYNYSTVTVDLGEYLRGRALYAVDSTGGDTPKLDGSTRRWVLSSVDNFAIENCSFPGISGLKLSNAIMRSSKKADTAAGVPAVRVSPSITGRLEITAADIDGYNKTPENENAGRKFWEQVHPLAITLSHISVQANTTVPNVTIYIPVMVKPANPKLLNITSDALTLNVTSANVYNLKTKKTLDETGGEAQDQSVYSAIYIRPTDLIEYSAPEGYPAMSFLHSSTRLNGSDDLQRQSGLRIDRVHPDNYSNLELGEETYPFPSVYKITASKSNSANSTYSISFTVLYYVGTNSINSRKNIDIEISVSTYGGYTIEFDPIQGKKAATYNVLSSGVFAEMRRRGYLLISARSLNEKQLSVDFQNNVLSLKPNVDNIDGQTTAKVSLTFTNTSKQEITFDSEIIDIDVNAGSLFARFDDWQAWLIISACILGGIIIILFIVWIFIHSLSKHKQAELAMQAPVSSYIVKLNSTIAATQAQQRLVQTQALSQASTMLLGVGPTGTAAPPPDTLQLATGLQSTPSAPSMSTPSAPSMSEPQAAVPPDSGENLEELIAKYITDDELLERIFTEKYEPKGMVRRTFFKSKDLQARELDKEKKRIIERYKSPMPMDEAIMSETEIKGKESTSSPAATSTPRTSEPKPTEMFVLDFDPDAPLYVEEEKASDEFTEEKIDIDSSPEEQRFKSLERSNNILAKELAELKIRLDKVCGEVDRAQSMEEELRAKISAAEADGEQFGKDIEDLEFKLASAKNKDKELIKRDIGIKEEKKRRNAEELEQLRAELETLLAASANINGVQSKLSALQAQKLSDQNKTASELEKARVEYDAYKSRLEQVRKRQELETKVTALKPLLEAVNNTDYEARSLDKIADEQAKERETLKSAVATAKSRILGTTDFSVIADLNATVSETNSRLSELEKEITKNTKRKSDIGIEFNSQRRKANDFIEKNEIPLDLVIKAEDEVVGKIEFEIVKAQRENYKAEAERAVANAQAVYDDISVSADDVTMVAMDVASSIKDIEDEIDAMQAELDAVNAQMDAAGEDEKLLLMVDQGDKSDKLDALKAKLEQANIDGTKRKLNAQSEYDTKLENARVALAEANAEFEKACESFNEFTNNTDPLDLITSGCGIISQDQKKIDAENLKKQLERSKNEIEQARLAAQQAQMAAEETRRKAQEEADEARRKAMEEAEEARRIAQEEAEQARLDAERRANEAVEQAEQARLEAEEKARADIEAAERARREAEEAMANEAEEARRKAQNEAEEARRKAEEDAEQAKRKAQEEIEEMRRKTEEEAEAKRREEEQRQKIEAERNEAIAKKVGVRKDQIIALRNEIKDLKNDDDAKRLRERLYNLQLTYDEDERGSSELMDFYNKTMDDIQNSGEIARLKAENAKKPQRVVRKVTERVNRIPKRKPGAPGARPGIAARPGMARPGAPRPGARPGGPARPGMARPGAPRPVARPGGPARPGAPRPGGKPPSRPR